MSHSYTKLAEIVGVVETEILRRHPGCHYTVKILLWDDDTCKICAQHGDGENIYTVTWYDGEVTYESCPMLSNRMSGDAEGNQFYVLTPEESEVRNSKYTVETVH